ncbi:MAG: GTP cyclohydrolase I, partial [Bdellovibrionaceae bacterium]|nr:GTP cyclohydrolase I [Pseudobdellovibrionaceae bacterium]
ARAVAVKIKAQHMCMMMRGVKKINSTTLTEFSLNSEKLKPDEYTRLWKAIE